MTPTGPRQPPQTPKETGSVDSIGYTGGYTPVQTDAEQHLLTLFRQLPNREQQLLTERLEASQLQRNLKNAGD